MLGEREKFEIIGMHRGLATAGKLNRLDAHFGAVVDDFFCLIRFYFTIRVVRLRRSEKFGGESGAHSIRAEMTVLIAEIGENELHMHGLGRATLPEIVHTIYMPQWFQL